MMRVNVFRFRGRGLKELRVKMTDVLVQEATLPHPEGAVETICAVYALPTESISRHANEWAGGERIRALVIHDMRHSAIQLGQIEGRCHRDGEKAVIYYLYAEGTVEERIAATVVRRMADMDGMAGDDTGAIDDIVLRIYGEDRATGDPT